MNIIAISIDIYIDWYMLVLSLILFYFILRNLTRIGLISFITLNYYYFYFEGDCIHTVKPYFGLGVNCAFEDVLILNTALDR